MHSGKSRIAIACTTYNHEKYIARAIESFLMQQVSEPFEIHICDDASTDDTQRIIKTYQQKYPNIIKTYLQKKNLWQKGYAISKYVLFPAISAEYVALCEGDDYFTAPLKLQKQVDFLDQHKEYAICFHPVKVTYETGKNDEIFPAFPDIVKKNTFTLSDLLIKNFIQTNSCMYRWRFNSTDTPKNLIPDNIMPCDHYWHLLHAETGKIGKLDEVMSVYNRRKEGIWTGIEDGDPNWYFNNALPHIRFCLEIEKKYKNVHYSDLKKNLAMNLFIVSLEHQRYEFIAELKKYPELMQYALEMLKKINPDQDMGKLIKFILTKA